MEKKIGHYIRELSNLYKGEPWLDVTILAILKTADENTAFAKPLPNSHSAAEITCHIIAWREFLLSRINGNKDFEVDQERSFDTSKYSEEGTNTWQNILNALEENHNRLISSMEKADDNVLEQDVHNRDFKLKFLIDGIIQHDAYHFGQIVLLLKQVKL